MGGGVGLNGVEGEPLVAAAVLDTGSVEVGQDRLLEVRVIAGRFHRVVGAESAGAVDRAAGEGQGSVR